MQSYSIIAAAFLFAASSAGLGVNVFAAEQAGPEGDASQTRSQTLSPANKDMLHVLAEFTDSLNVKKLKPGDRIKAEVTQDVLSHGRIIIPVESKLLGHVTEVKARGKEETESRLGIVFDKVLLKHHEEMDFQGVVQALALPAFRRSKLDEPDQMLFPLGIVGSQNGNAPTPLGSKPSPRGSSQSRSTNTNPRTGTGSVPSFPPFVDSTLSSDLRHAMDVTDPNRTNTGSPLSAGMRQGVFGLKGLSLSTGPSRDTPGPVILSKVRDVKLESGTQVLLRITDTPPRP